VDLTAKAIDDIAAGEKTPWIVGVIRYKDPVGNEHLTRFEMIYDPSADWSDRTGGWSAAGVDEAT
jgi:hypothetical protein